MIDRNVVSEILPHKLEAWSGPVNLNTHHDVLIYSATTPVRLVSNSSFPNESTPLNELILNGPNTLNCLLSNIIRFRGYQVALVGDISKAYNSIKTRLKIKFNPSKKCKGIRSKPNLSMSDLESFRTSTFSKGRF